jgi:hypothetical protein
MKRDSPTRTRTPAPLAPQPCLRPLPDKLIPRQCVVLRAREGLRLVMVMASLTEALRVGEQRVESRYGEQRVDVIVAIVASNYVERHRIEG